MVNNTLYWLGAACLGLFGGFFAGAALCLAQPTNPDGDTHAFIALFWALGGAPIGAVVSLVSAAFVRQVMEPLPGQRPAAGQYAAAAGIMMIAPIIVMLALSFAQSHRSRPAEAKSPRPSAGISTPAPPPAALGNFAYPGMSVLQYNPTLIAASTQDSLSTVETYFNGLGLGAPVDCTANGVACQEWTGTMSSGAHVAITARSQHSRDLLMDGDVNAPVNTKGPVLIEYDISL